MPRRDRYEDDRDDDDYDFDERRRHRRRRSAERHAIPPLAWVGIAVGGVVALSVFVVILTLPGRDRENKPAGPVGGAKPGGSKPFDPSVRKAEPIAFPELGPSRPIERGIQFQEATLRRGAMPMKVWFYRPENAVGNLPVVFVPPAGSTLCAGMDLGEGDRAEHFPYARAGFAVASFEIDGHVPNQQNATDAAVFKGAREFRDANAGLANATTALDFILAKAPNVDPNRIYIAGHSSAATLALLVAEHEPRIKGCAAYCAVTDVEERLGRVIPLLDREIPGYRDFLRFSSPKTQASKLKCPVFLFHAQDDSNVPVSQTTTFAALLKQSNPNVTLIADARGDHYNSMIAQGIPKGITWFKQLSK